MTTEHGVVPAVGDRFVVTALRVAHGGHVIARHEGRVVFVRHALPGETVEVEVTEVGRRAAFVRADAIAVLEASPDRVDPPCALAHPGGCGGCDWQHVRPARQRELKAEVLREQLTRLGGLVSIGGRLLGEAVAVEAVPGDHDGLRWRTRARYAIDAQGHPGFHRHRSHEVVAVERCPLVTDEVDEVGVSRTSWLGADELGVVVSSQGDRAVWSDRRSPAAIAQLPSDVSVLDERGRRWVREHAAGRDWRVQADGFWQVHPGAADALVTAVREALAVRPGEHLLDLYSGVGLFAGALAGALGPEGVVDAVESAPRACADARRNLHDLPTVRIHESSVGAWLRWQAPDRADVVVLDPPRRGAGEEIVRRVVERRPRAVAYVACDPAALGRDVAVFRALGWRPTWVRGFDLFPMTHHVEAVALLEPEAVAGGPAAR